MPIFVNINMEAQFNELAKMIHADNVDRGFRDGDVDFGTRLMLIVSELSEALEADRKGKPMPNLSNWEMGKIDWTTKLTDSDADAFRQSVKDTMPDEIADAIIRLLDLVGAIGIDIEAHMKLKLAYNRTRPFKHGKRY